MPRTCFNLKRHDLPLNEYELSDPITTGISSSRSFIELQALKQWGASLDDLKAWKDGSINRSLLDLMVYFYIGDQLYQNHKNDAVALEIHNRRERAKKNN